jgi:hypothetical protein
LLKAIHAAERNQSRQAGQQQTQSKGVIKQAVNGRTLPPALPLDPGLWMVWVF